MIHIFFSHNFLVYLDPYSPSAFLLKRFREHISTSRNYTISEPNSFKKMPRRNGLQGRAEGLMPGMPGRASAGRVRGMPGQGLFLVQNPYTSQMSPLDQLKQFGAQHQAFRAQIAANAGQAGQQGQAQAATQIPGHAPAATQIPGHAPAETQIPGHTPASGRPSATAGQNPAQVPPMPGRAAFLPLARLQLNAGKGIPLPTNLGYNKGFGPLPILHQMRRQRHDPRGYLRPRTEADGPYTGVLGGAREGRRRGGR